ncbi:MAG: type I glyceraldehyde-3-phosphate dehydrogenase [Myxococcota bacterium]
MTKIAINGFGRIGRCIARILLSSNDTGLELTAINDLTDNEMLAHLLRYDSVHGPFAGEVALDGDDHIVINGTRVRSLAERDPSKLPWKDLGAEIILECTGRFRDKESASQHLSAGAKRVIISAPGKGVDGTFCVGINTDGYDANKHAIISNASCTTNCLSPIAKVLHETFEIVKGHMVTVHSYTNDQRILDLPHKDKRRARAAALSMIPTTTGAAAAVGLVLPALQGKLDGSAIRVPTPNVSLVNLTAQVGKATTRDAVNAAFREASEGPLQGILGFEKQPLVSTDFNGRSESSVVDAAQTQVVGDDLVVVQSWYDNEWGFSHRMVDLAKFIA